MTEPWHVPAPVLRRYADRTGETLSSAQAASVEAHLDDCARCRGQLNPGPDDDLLARIGADLFAQAERTPQFRRPRRWWITFTAGVPSAWLLAVLAVSLTAGLLDPLMHTGDSTRPSLLLLLTPVLPLAAVAAAWSPRVDPMYELSASTPAAGLLLLLRRTVVVLLVVILLSVGLSLAVAGFGVETSPARWLLPALALSAGSLALGSVVQVHRAAVALGGGWVLAVVLPGLDGTRVPVVLDTAAAPVWAIVLVVAIVVVALQHKRFRYLKL